MKPGFSNFACDLSQRLELASKHAKSLERLKSNFVNTNKSTFNWNMTNEAPTNTSRNLYGDSPTFAGGKQSRAKSNKTFPVYAKVKTMKNHLEELMRFMLRPSNSVRHLRRYLAKKFKVHLEQVDLLYRNRVLLDHQIMSVIGLGTTGYLTVNITGDSVPEDDTLTVLQDAQSFVSLQLRSISPKAMASFRLEDVWDCKFSLWDLKLPATFTAESLKMYLSDRLKRPTKQMKLTLKRTGKELTKHAQLRDELQEKDVIQLTRKNGGQVPPKHSITL